MKENDIKKSPIYVEAMMHHRKNMGKVLWCLCGFVFMIMFFAIVADKFAGKKCIQECENEGKITNCNDFCY